MTDEILSQAQNDNTGGHAYLPYSESQHAGRQVSPSQSMKNGVEPSGWLTDVLTRIQDHPVNRIEELLPDKWEKQSPTKDNQ